MAHFKKPRISKKVGRDKIQQKIGFVSWKSTNSEIRSELKNIFQWTQFFSSRSFSSEKKSWKKLKFGKILKFWLASLGSFGRLVGCGVKEGLSLLLPLGGAKTFGRMVEPRTNTDDGTWLRSHTPLRDREKKIKDLHPTGIEPTTLYLLVPRHVLLATTASQPIKIIFYDWICSAKAAVKSRAIWMRVRFLEYQRAFHCHYIK